MRVILTHHVPDDAGRFHVGTVGRMALLVHREQDAAVHGLEAVARIRQRAADDHAHGVVEIGALQLVFDGDRGDAAAPITIRRGMGFFGQGKDLAV